MRPLTSELRRLTRVGWVFGSIFHLSTGEMRIRFSGCVSGDSMESAFRFLFAFGAAIVFLSDVRVCEAGEESLFLLDDAGMKALK